jgi:hypothetical protein
MIGWRKNMGREETGQVPVTRSDDDECLIVIGDCCNREMARATQTHGSYKKGKK